jgi:DNA end-binding protein Ku
LAGSLIDQKTAPFDAGEFHDRYVDALKKLVEKKAKAKGKKIIEEPDAPAAKSAAKAPAKKAAVKKAAPAKKRA